MKLSTLREANTARQALWDPLGRISLDYASNEMAGEAGEACNEIKKLSRERLGLPGSRTTLAKAASELADLVICADLVAMKLNIDLGAAVAAKFNETSRKVGFPIFINEDA